MTIPKRISASIMPTFKSIRPGILIDAGVIVSAFYLTNAYFSVEAALPLAALLFLLWSRGWALNGETRGKAAIATMAGIMLVWAGIHSGAIEDTVEEITETIIGQKEEAAAPLSLSYDTKWDRAAAEVIAKDKAAAAVDNPYMDLVDQEVHRKRVEAELSSYEQTARLKREDEAMKREKECLAKHEGGSREMRDCLMESKRETLGLDPAWGALPELPK